MYSWKFHIHQTILEEILDNVQTEAKANIYIKSKKKKKNIFWIVWEDETSDLPKTDLCYLPDDTSSYQQRPKCKNPNPIPCKILLFCFEKSESFSKLVDVQTFCSGSCNGIHKYPQQNTIPSNKLITIFEIYKRKINEIWSKSFAEKNK